MLYLQSTRILHVVMLAFTGYWTCHYFYCNIPHKLISGYIYREDRYKLNKCHFARFP